MVNDDSETIAALRNENEALRQRLAALEKPTPAHSTIQQVQSTTFSLAFFDAIPVPIQVYAPDGFMVTMNAASEAFWKVSRTDAAGIFNILQDPQLQDQGIPALFLQALQGQVIISHPHHIDTAHIEEIERQGDVANWIESTYFPMYAQDDTIAYLGVLNVDVTSKVEKDQALEATEILLNESQTLFQGLSEFSPTPIFIKDTEGHVIVANRQLDTFLGAEPGTLIGKTVYDLLPSDVADGIWESELRVLQTGEPLLIEENVPIGDDIHTLITTKFPIYNKQGEAYAIGGIITDITQLKRAEQSIARESQANAAMAELSKALLTTSSLDDISTVVLDYAQQLTNSSLGFAGYIDTQTGYLVVPTMTREVWAECQVSDKKAVFEQFGGLWGWVLNNRTPLLTNTIGDDPRSSGVPAGHVGITRFLSAPALVGDNLVGQIALANAERDYTSQDLALLERFASLYAIVIQRNRMEDELHIFRALADYAPDPIALSDMEGVTFYVNPAYRAMLGYGDASIGMDVSEFFTPEMLEYLPQVLQVIQGEGRWQGELVHLCKDGSTFVGLNSGFLIRDEQGNPRAMAAIVRDLTETKRAEEERQMLQQQVIDAQQAAIRELSTPLIPLSYNVVLMPLIGSIDSSRAQLVMETLLEGIAHYQADTVILDITGVSVVDTQVANAFIQSAQAVRLLGARVILTGIGPSMAQTLVHLGVDLSSLETRGSLQSAVVEALGKK